VSESSIEQERDDQELAETLDVETLSDDIDDPAGELAYPPERPLGVNQYGTTAAEERVGEPSDERARRDTRDPLDAIAEPDDEELRQIERDETELADALDDDITLDELGDALEDATALDDLDPSGQVGRLVDPAAVDDAVDAEDDEPDAVAMAADLDERDLSAEEDAVHLTRDPPLGHLGDGYVSEDDRG
jgi:hypothetical protein